MSWEGFALRYLLWPLMVQAVMLLVCLVLGFCYRNLRWKRARLIEDYVGTEAKEMKKPLLYVLIQLVQLVLSVFSTGQWVVRTYRHTETELDNLIELVLGVFYTFTYILQLLKAGFSLGEALSLASWVDILSTAPVFAPALFVRGEQWLSLGFLRILRALTAYARIENTGMLRNVSELSRAVILMVLRLLGLGSSWESHWLRTTLEGWSSVS